MKRVIKIGVVSAGLGYLLADMHVTTLDSGQVALCPFKGDARNESERLAWNNVRPYRTAYKVGDFHIDPFGFMLDQGEDGRYVDMYGTNLTAPRLVPTLTQVLIPWGDLNIQSNRDKWNGPSIGHHRYGNFDIDMFGFLVEESSAHIDVDVFGYPSSTPVLAPGLTAPLCPWGDVKNSADRNRWNDTGHDHHKRGNFDIDMFGYLVEESGSHIDVDFCGYPVTTPVLCHQITEMLIPWGDLSIESNRTAWNSVRPYRQAYKRGDFMIDEYGYMQDQGGDGRYVDLSGGNVSEPQLAPGLKAPLKAKTTSTDTTTTDGTTTDTTAAASTSSLSGYALPIALALGLLLTLGMGGKKKRK